MPIKFFWVPATLPGEAEAELNRFLGGHQVVSIDRHFGSANGAPVWCFAIEYIVPAYGARDTNAANPAMRKDRIDYKEVLSPDVFARFSKLRELRKQIAESEGLPVYAVFTNEQLAAMAQTCPASKSALQAIDGIGDAKSERYGQRVLELIATLVPPPQPPA